MDQGNRLVEYYDRNTPKFLRFGGGRKAAAIHRALWTPGVQNKTQALLYTNHLVAEAIRPALENIHDPHLLDLGCGVGGTALYVAQHLEARVTGLTISPVQAQIAAQRASELGLDERCRFLVADFLSPPEIEPAQAAYAIEAFSHAGDARMFFHQASRVLVPGGRLILCDDFLSESRLPYIEPNRQKWVDRFRQGWRLESLIASEQATQLAKDAGFTLLETTDLTPLIRLPHPAILPLLKLISAIPLHSPYWGSLSGGIALQVCQKMGWAKYYLLVLQKEFSTWSS